MKTLVKLVVLFSLFHSVTTFAAKFSYKCIDQKQSRNAYFQIKESSFLSTGYFHWNWDYPDFDNSLFKFKLSEQYKESGRICFKDEINVILIRSKTDYCLSPEMLTGSKFGTVKSWHSEGNVIDSTGNYGYHFACERE